ncbi:MAG: type II secretion system protein [Verrucomicrobiota bacterium]
MRTYRSGFNTLELLAVMVIVGLALLIATPFYRSTRERAETLRCASNLKQLYLANTAYANQHGTYVAAAPDMAYPPGSNLKRWHGERTTSREAFDGDRSPLAPFMGTDRSLRRCPTFKSFKTGANHNAFESSCGGYGYNHAGVGSRSYQFGFNGEGLERGMKPMNIRKPAQTVMFTDAAFPQPYGRPDYLIEYSFAEAYHFISSREPEETRWTASPSIHFRHNDRANVIWCDGHLSAEKLTMIGYPGSGPFRIGWFGEADNALFDPF